MKYDSETYEKAEGEKPICLEIHRNLVLFFASLSDKQRILFVIYRK